MSGYYPWGPHGPQSSPAQVTPNPTPAYVPPPATPSYSNPNPISYGGGYSGGSAYAGYSGPPRKSYAVAILLSAIFGPLGLLYANRKAAKIILALVAAVVVWQVLSTSLPVINRAGGFLSFIGDSEALSGAWSLATFASVVLSRCSASVRTARRLTRRIRLRQGRDTIRIRSIAAMMIAAIGRDDDHHLNAVTADRRKWSMLPYWRRRERRALAEGRLNHHFNEIERILAQSSTPDTHRRPHHARQQSTPIEWLPVAGVIRREGIGWGVYVDHGNGFYDHYPVGPSREDAEAEAVRAQAESRVWQRRAVI